MSRSTVHTVTCSCGNVFTSTVYKYVNVVQDPHWQYIVLAGLLNVSTCPQCGHRATIPCPFIYSDPAHNLLAYVYPRTNTPEEARLLVLEKLRSVYLDVPSEQQDSAEESSHTSTSSVILITASHKKELPPLQVVFGLNHLTTLINKVLSPAERMGRIALNTQSRSEAERGRLLDIARKLASEMACNVEVKDRPNDYTVWMYGSRRQIGVLMRELTNNVRIMR